MRAWIRARARAISALFARFAAWTRTAGPRRTAMAPSDAAQRARALDTRTSFIVQAPAGSGKTELLIQRYLALLAVVEEPEAIVAITFTKKAAAEMRNRVLDALADAESDEQCAEHRRVTRELARAALARDRQKG